MIFESVHKLTNKLLRVAHLFGFRSAPSRRDKGTEAMAYVKNAFILKFAINLNHSVRIDHEGFGQSANAWQLVADCE